MRKLCVRGMWGLMCAGGLLLGGCNGGGSSSSYLGGSGGSYEAAELTLEEKERMNPVDFLSMEGTYRTNLIGEYVMEGTIRSSARVAVYKDVQVQVDFVSKTGTVIGTKYATVYEFVRPGSGVRYKIKMDGYRGTSKVSMGVVGAGVE